MRELNPRSIPEEDNARASILIVDDQDANLLVLRTVLEPLGHNIVEARSGIEALELLKEQEFAVALIDIRMPVLDGCETAARIRSRPNTLQLPIIFITGFDSSDFPAIEAYRLGNVDYLVKPIVPEILRAKVSGLVNLFTAQLQAKRQADELRLLVESTTDYAIFLLDIDGKVKTWNAGASRMKGYEAHEIIGKHFSIFYPPERIASHWPEHELEVARAVGRFEEEGWRLRKDGTEFWANVTITALRDSHGELLGYSKITRDLSERKAAEEQLRSAQSELEQRVAARTAELEHAITQLKDADQRKDDFLAMLSHEIRNPLAPIRNALQIIRMPGITPRESEVAHSIMERQLAHLVRIVDDLLDVSRIMRGKITLKRERLELKQIFSQAVESVQPLLKTQQHDLNVSLPADPVFVMGDPVRFGQALTNLLVNAAKYTPKGGRIVLEGKQSQNRISISVRDNGVGIGAELLPKIFDLFMQGEQSLARSHGGLGIGLTLVKRIVEMHQGEVSASSEGSGQGAEFTMELPVPDGLSEGAEIPDFEPDAGSGLARRVLVVDDNIDAAESTALLLRHMGHEVEVLHEGGAVLNTVRKFKPSVLLLDIGLPDVDGFQVAHDLRAEPDLRGLVIAAVTGYGQSEDRKRSKEVGFDFHLTKPLELEALNAVFNVQHS